MRILLATKKYAPRTGGDAVVVKELEKEYNSRGDEVIILTTHNIGSNTRKNNTKSKQIIYFGLEERDENLDSFSLRRIVSLCLLLFRSFGIVAREKPDIIHSHSVDLGFALSFAARAYRIPHVLTCHGVAFPYPQYAGLLKRHTEILLIKFGCYRHIITVDSHALPSFKKNGIANVVFIPNGTRIPRAPIKKSRTGILTVARLEEQKGLAILIEAIATLKREKIRNIPLVTIVGDGSQRASLERLTRELSVSTSIRFTGALNRSATNEKYRSANIFVLPSLWEGMPLTILEAWAHQLPVIATRVGGIPQTCTDGKDALLIQAGNSKALAGAIKKIVQMKTLRERLGKTGYRNVQHMYDWKQIASSTRRLYL
jgi:glycosyltransferase involved in cell wall biosynthesis